MKNIGNSIIEIIVVLTVISVGIMGAYTVLNSSTELSVTAQNRIKAINFAREGIEQVQNIRDTNWIKFSSDYDHCWVVKNYSGSCVGTDYSRDFTSGNSFVSYFSGGLIYLEDKGPTTSTFDAAYKKKFPIYLDSNGLSTQTGATTTSCSALTGTGCLSIFTREISLLKQGTDHLQVSSIVHWSDSGRNHEVRLKTILTNWKLDL